MPGQDELFCTKKGGNMTLRLGLKTLPAAFAATLLAITIAPAARSQATASTATPADTGGLAEVVVTAQYRAEPLQQTPIAITAVTAEDIQARGFTSSTDIAYAVPNASFRQAQAAFGKTQTAYIRGVGQNDFNFAFEPGVGTYVDDVYYPTTMSSQFDLMDLERVEVLRGPQGTLFGRGSIGGAVRYVSKQPTGDNTGYIEGTVGDFHRVDLRAGYDFALIENKLFVRITGVSKKEDGYVDRMDFVCLYPALSGSLPREITNRGAGCKVGTMGGTDVNGARALFRFVASDTVTIGLSVDYQRDDSEAAADTLVQAGPLGGGFAAWSAAMQNGYPGTPFKGYGVPFDSRFVPSNRYVSYATFSDPVSGLSFPPQNALNQKGISSTADWKISDEISAKLILAWRNWNGRFATDQSDAPLDVSLVDGIQQFTYRTAELRFTGDMFEHKLNWTAGVFYYDGDSNSTQAVNLPGDQNLTNYFTNPVANSLLVNGLEVGHFQNDSAFLHTVYNLTDSVRMTLGARYSRDKKDDNFDNTIVVAQLSHTSSRGDWRLGFDWQLDPEVLLYTSASTGYRPPAFNPRPFQASQFVAVSGESLVAYEIGEKADLLDRKLRVNLALFYSDYAHRIVPVGGTDCLNAPGTNIPISPCIVIPKTDYVNSPGKLYGGEIEAAFRPIDPLTFTLTAGETRFSTNATGAAAGITPNGEPVYVPQWNGAFSAKYVLTLPNGSTLTPRYDAFVQTQICSGAANPQSGYTGITSCTGGYTLHNVRLEYGTHDHAWTTAIGVENLANHFYYLNKFDLTGFGEPTIEGQPGQPRTWYLTARRNF